MTQFSTGVKIGDLRDPNITPSGVRFEVTQESARRPDPTIFAGFLHAAEAAGNELLRFGVGSVLEGGSEWMRFQANNIVRPLASLALGADIPIEATNAVAKITTAPIQEAADDVRAFADRNFPGNIDLQGHFFWDVLPRGASSLAVYTAAVAGGTALGGPALGLTAAGGLAGLSGVSEAKTRLAPLVASGELTEEEANQLSAAGALPELVQLLPAVRVARRLFGAGVAKTIVGKLTSATVTGTAEAGAETVGVFGQNFIEKVGGGRKGEEWYEGFQQEAAAGGILGFVADIAATALGMGGKRLRGLSTRETGNEILKELAVKGRVIDQEEAVLLGDNVQLREQLVGARLEGKNANLVVAEDGTVSVEEKEGHLSWRQIEAVNHNPVVIDELRKMAERGESIDFFTEPETGPVGSDEVVEVEEALRSFQEKIKVELDEIADGVPRTERARILFDIETTLARLPSTGEAGGRILLEQAKALVRTARRLGDSTSKIPLQEGVASAGGKVTTPLDMAPVPRLKFQLPQADRAGYLARPVDLSSDPVVQRRIATAQRRAVQQLGVTRRSLKLPPAEREVVSRLIDEALVERVAVILKIAEDTPQRVKKKLTQHVADSDLPAVEQVSIIDFLADRIDKLAEETTLESQRGAIERLLTDLRSVQRMGKDRRPVEIPRGTIPTVQKFYERMLGRAEKGELDSEKAVLGLNKLRALTSAVKWQAQLAKEGEQGRAKMVELVSTLPPEQARGFLERANRAETLEDFESLAKDIGEAQEAYIRQQATERVVAAVKKGVAIRAGEKNANPRRMEVVGRLRSLAVQPKSRPVQTGKPATLTLYRAGIPTKGEAYFTDDPKIAASYRKQDTTVDQYTVILKNPLVVDDSKNQWPQDKAVNEARRRGFDSVIIKNVQDLGRRQNQIIVFGETPSGTPLSVQPEPHIYGIPNTVAELTTSVSGKPSKSVLKKVDSGREKVDYPALKAALAQMPVDQVRMLGSDLTRLVRQGAIEQGLYNKWLGYIKEQDLENVTGDIARFKVRERTVVGQMAGIVADPVSSEGWLYQVAQAEEARAIYQLFHSNIEHGWSRFQQHAAETRRYVDSKMQSIYNIPNTSRGARKFMDYMNEKLEGGMRRGEAMWAYALSTDEGRVEAVKSDGVQVKDKVWDWEQAEGAIGQLSQKDKDFVDQTKEFFVNNPTFEGAFRVHLMLTGSEIERFGRWFTSRRAAQGKDRFRLVDTYSDLLTDLEGSTSALKARVEQAGTPFDVEGGYFSAFLRVSDQLGKFAEMGLPLHRASQLLNDPTLQREFIARFSEARLEQLQDHMRSIMGHLGRNRDIMDTTVNYLTRAWAAGKIVWNFTSIVRQTLAFTTMVADDVIDTGALLSARAMSASVSKRVGKEMMAKSGMAYMRLDPKHFAEHMLILSDSTASTKLTDLSNRSFVFQRIMDGRVLRTAWRAVELMADKRGLTGRAREQYIVETFDKALARSQSSNSPMYESRLETAAKKQPLWRGVIALQRELNRQYNVARRRVVTARMKPSLENIAGAGMAIFTLGVIDTVLSTGLNELRDKAFGEPFWDEEKRVSRWVNDLAGRWFLLGDATQMAVAIVREEDRFYQATTLLGPFGDIGFDTYELGKAVFDAATVDEEEWITRGPKRGKSKVVHNLERAFSEAISVGSSVLGLPFWAVWSQGRGLYQWTEKDYRLMLELEAQWERVDEESPERVRLQAVRDRVNEIHQLRERGLLSRSAARTRVVQELERGLN